MSQKRKFFRRLLGWLVLAAAILWTIALAIGYVNSYYTTARPQWTRHWEHKTSIVMPRGDPGDQTETQDSGIKIVSEAGSLTVDYYDNYTRLQQSKAEIHSFIFEDGIWLPVARPRPPRFKFEYINTPLTSAPGMPELATRTRSLLVTVPYWLPLGISLLIVFLMTWRIFSLRRQAARAGKGLCTGCGYDLRASVDRCPECGKSFPASAAIAPVAKDLA